MTYRELMAEVYRERGWTEERIKAIAKAAEAQMPNMGLDEVIIGISPGRLKRMKRDALAIIRTFEQKPTMIESVLKVVTGTKRPENN